MRVGAVDGWVGVSELVDRVQALEAKVEQAAKESNEIQKLVRAESFSPETVKDNPYAQRICAAHEEITESGHAKPELELGMA